MVMRSLYVAFVAVVAAHTCSLGMRYARCCYHTMPFTVRVTLPRLPAIGVYAFCSLLLIVSRCCFAATAPAAHSAAECYVRLPVYAAPLRDLRDVWCITLRIYGYVVVTRCHGIYRCRGCCVAPPFDRSAVRFTYTVSLYCVPFRLRSFCSHVDQLPLPPFTCSFGARAVVTARTYVALPFARWIGVWFYVLFAIFVAGANYTCRFPFVCLPRSISVMPYRLLHHDLRLPRSAIFAPAGQVVRTVVVTAIVIPRCLFSPCRSFCTAHLPILRYVLIYRVPAAARVVVTLHAHHFATPYTPPAAPRCYICRTFCRTPTRLPHRLRHTCRYLDDCV